jgi:hypothetical protein
VMMSDYGSDDGMDNWWRWIGRTRTCSKEEYVDHSITNKG